MASWNDPQRAELVESYRRSGLGQEEFCRGLLHRGIRLSPRTLRAWTARLEPPVSMVAECLHAVDRALSDLRQVRHLLTAMNRNDEAADRGTIETLDYGTPAGTSPAVAEAGKLARGHGDRLVDGKPSRAPESVPVGTTTTQARPSYPAVKPRDAALPAGNALFESHPMLPALVPKRPFKIW